MPPPSVEKPLTPRRSPRLAAQSIKKEAEEDEPAHNTRSKQVQRKPSTQEEMLAHLHAAQRKITPDWLAQRSFPLEMLSAGPKKDTGELMEYQKLMKKTKYWNLYHNSYAKEIGRLAQGILCLVKGTNTMLSI